MNYAEDVIRIAKAEEGYLEKKTNANLDDKTANAGNGNWTKYARDMDQIANFYNGKKNGYDWCDVFVDWCFTQAFGRDQAQKLLCQPDKSCGAGCKFSAMYFRNKGRFVKNPTPGDQIFYGKVGDETHTGIVEKVDDKYVYTIEGNWSNKVCCRKLLKTDATIAGYGHPAFDIKPEPKPVEPTPAPQPIVDEIKVGDKVKVKAGVTTYYNGVKCSSWVLKITLYAREKQVKNGIPVWLVSTSKSLPIYTGRFKVNDIYKL